MHCPNRSEGTLIETLILIGGVLVTLAVAAIMIRPTRRIPALVVGILSIPGNVDNYVPQMQMDLHALPNNTGPAISVIDLLITWAVILTIRERHDGLSTGRARALLVAAGVVAVVAALASVTSVVVLGVEPMAAVRGIIAFARIPALVYLAVALLPLDPRHLFLSVAAALGAIALLGNGIYTSLAQDQARFTAATFGRNGLGVALALVALLAAGAALSMMRGSAERRGAALLLAAIGAMSLFGSVATGTRMALVAFAVGLVIALVLMRAWRSRRRLIEAGALGVASLVVIAAAGLTTTAGSRSVSVLADIDDYENLSEQSEVRSRADFWIQAGKMASLHPLTGVGPYQFNIVRYEMDSNAPVVLANPHNTYLQIAAEYGFVTLAAYLTLLGGMGLYVAVAPLRRGLAIRGHWSSAMLLACAATYPVTELTNSHLFNVRLGAFGWIILGTAVAVALRDAAPPRTSTVRRGAMTGASAKTGQLLSRLSRGASSPYGT